jgi:hypothetical protein
MVMKCVPKISIGLINQFVDAKLDRTNSFFVQLAFVDHVNLNDCFFPDQSKGAQDLVPNWLLPSVDTSFAVVHGTANRYSHKGVLNSNSLNDW